MNMQATFTLVTAHRARPKGVLPARRQQERSEVEEKFRFVLHQWGYPHDWNWALAYQAYDAYTAHWGYAPPNKNYLEAAMASEEGREWLAKAAAPIKAEWDAMQANRAADTARKAAEAPKIAAVAPTLVVGDYTPKPQRDIPGRLRGKLCKALTEARQAHLRSGATAKERDDTLIDEAIIAIYEACAAEQVNYFTTQYANWTKVSGLLIGRLTELQKAEKVGKFALYWTPLSEGGLEDEVVEMPLVKPAPTTDVARKARGAHLIRRAKTPDEQAEARKKAAARKARKDLEAAAESAASTARKGKSGDGGGKGGQKKGKGNK